MMGAHFRLLVIAAVVVSGACRRPAPPTTGPAAVSATAGDSSCVAAFDSLQSVFAHDYPGYREKVAGHEAALAALTDSVRATARSADGYQVCIPARCSAGRSSSATRTS
jgi:hypothetical protein